ncbi:LysM peptidoglycan-binding domain-containing protein [Saccharibacillus sp. JS10]|uniref:LysM peptidoglycan-binding domain-containing protein n=1 Tax=Saccharibacillus sp. JS10 TaxID=2950552 RepID=UPI0021089478|nr:LysM peptidoglycan-binding domain-containing protein [Saccharibacillus sp. JS10]MCQ4085613.1 LysM peptidoglycan-binding domain-containing protein [Saccharibacillus sp. JS10]
MPKYTSYKSIYESATVNKEERNSVRFSLSSFLHSHSLPKYKWNKAGAARMRLLVFVVIGLFAGTGVVHAFQNHAEPVEVRTVVVSPGDTLWSIAENHKPQDADTRIFVSGIKQKNNLDDSIIYAGEELILPNF